MYARGAREDGKSAPFLFIRALARRLLIFSRSEIKPFGELPLGIRSLGYDDERREFSGARALTFCFIPESLPLRDDYCASLYFKARMYRCVCVCVSSFFRPSVVISVDSLYASSRERHPVAKFPNFLRASGRETREREREERVRKRDIKTEWQIIR